jgi:hypothetical protein
MSQMVDLEARERIQALEAQGVQRNREIARLSEQFSRFAATLDAIGVNVSGDAPARRIDSPAVPPNFPMPTPAVPSVATPPRAPAPFAIARSPSQARRTRPPVALPAPAGFPSLIVSQFPALFAEFRGKRFTLLWRGSRDGFGARDFHGRCDGHANTLTFIEDTAGNIFGGFTPVEWESREYDQKATKALGRSNCLKADPSLTSFLFTLKNPHKFPPKKFALKAEDKDQAIYCVSSWGPSFWDVAACDNCNAKAESFAYRFGECYTDDTGLNGETFLTGSKRLTAKEIEVFEIMD